MTSKEALEHIINNDYNQIICTIPAQEAYNGLTKEEMTKIVEKDLEVLEILKEIFVNANVQLKKWDILGDASPYIVETDSKRVFISEDIYTRLKEWLEK